MNEYTVKIYLDGEECKEEKRCTSFSLKYNKNGQKYILQLKKTEQNASIVFNKDGLFRFK